jgi:AraC-like DNA-binding protein
LFKNYSIFKSDCSTKTSFRLLACFFLEKPFSYKTIAMGTARQLNKVGITQEKSLKTLVENRTAYTLEKCELNVFETHQATALVPLTFNDFVVTSMLRGKKVMHLYGQDGFDYLPGETVLVPGGVTMNIDFPEATKDNPTQCIALAIDHQKIENTLSFLNDKYPRMGNDYWNFSKNNYHFQNSIEIANLLNKIINICSSTLPLKDVLADLNLQELIVNIIQSQNRLVLDQVAEAAVNTNANPLAYITGFIKANINEDIKLGVLSEKACMSKATFYRSFKKEYGISPLEYVISEKIKLAKTLLANPKNTIKSVAFECGFHDVNYFVRLFKKMETITPGQYQMLILSNNKS